jgi:hypothetical protein
LNKTTKSLEVASHPYFDKRLLTVIRQKKFFDLNPELNLDSVRNFLKYKKKRKCVVDQIYKTN